MRPRIKYSVTYNLLFPSQSAYGKMLEKLQILKIPTKTSTLCSVGISVAVIPAELKKKEVSQSVDHIFLDKIQYFSYL